MTIPLWEKGNNDLGGNYEQFGGEKILREMKRRKLAKAAANESLKKNKKAQLTRSAGTNAQLIETTSKYCRIILSSGEHKFISPMCRATVGTVSNEFLFFRTIIKAGRNR